MSTIEGLLVRLRDEDDLDGCAEAIDWLAAREGTLEQVWDDCPRGNWLMRLAERLRRPRGAAAHVLSVAWDVVARDQPGWMQDYTRADVVRQHITAAMIVAVLDAHAAAAVKP